MYENIRDIKIDKAKLDSLYSKLAHGDVGAIAKEVKVSRQTVKEVLKGNHFNSDIIEATIKRIEDREAYKKSIESNIDRVVNS